MIIWRRPSSLSRMWVWHPISLHDTILCYTLLYHTVLLLAMLEMEPNPFQKKWNNFPLHDKMQFFEFYRLIWFVKIGEIISQIHFPRIRPCISPIYSYLPKVDTPLNNPGADRNISVTGSIPRKYQLFYRSTWI